MAQITNNNDNGLTQTMTYDPLDRILTAQTTANSGPDCWGLSFGVDPLANLLSMSPTKCSGPNLSVGVDANNHITGYGYDPGGNVTADGAYTYAYNAENEVTSANGVNYTYDGDGLRVEKSSGTLYWRSYAGQVIEETDANGVMQRDYIFFAGRRVAWKDGSGSVYYMFADAIGSTRVVTNSSGNTCFNADYYPYGQEPPYNSESDPSCLPHYRFTGYEYDAETQNYYAYAREYDPRIGRFLQADPLGGWVGNPQSLNRYSYVINNPESLIDPAGMFESGTPPPPPPAEGTFFYGDCIYSKTTYSDGYVDIEPILCGGGGFGYGNGNQGGSPQTTSCTPSPASATQYAEATAEVGLLTSEFFSGLGQTSQTFGPNSAMSQVMAQSAQVQDVLNNYAIAGAPGGLEPFGLAGLYEAGGNPVAQFLGSFRWTIAPTSGGLNLTLTNATSFKSLTYDKGPQWQRGTFQLDPFMSVPKPMGNIHQTINIFIPCE